jgi:dipeptidyl aminopeptidase/acylaminoacyl peptidase
MFNVLFVVLVLSGKLAFVNDGNIWIKALPDGMPIQVSQGGGAEFPQWSPSGHWLTFHQNKKIVAVSDSRERREITADRSAWSPYRDELAFVDQDGLCVIRLDAGDQQKRVVLRNSASAQVSGFAWSPDSTAFAVSVVTPDPARGPQFRVGHLWRITVDETQRQEIFTPKERGGIEPVGWSSEGQYILFQFDPDFSSSLAADGLPLFSIPAFGGPARELARNVLVHRDFLSVDRLRRDILVVNGGGRETWTGKRLTLIDPATGKLTELTDEKSVVASASWSPDGEQIAYVSGPDEKATEHQQVGTVVLPNGQRSRQVIRIPESTPKTLVNQRRIWMIGRDGKPRQVTSDSHYRDEYPIWSADGKSILFIRVDQEDRASLWTIGIENGTPQKLLDAPGAIKWFGYYGHFDWYNYLSLSFNE